MKNTLQIIKVILLIMLFIILVISWNEKQELIKKVETTEFFLESYKQKTMDLMFKFDSLHLECTGYGYSFAYGISKKFVDSIHKEKIRRIRKKTKYRKNISEMELNEPESIEMQWEN